MIKCSRKEQDLTRFPNLPDDSFLSEVGQPDKFAEVTPVDLQQAWLYIRYSQSIDWSIIVTCTNSTISLTISAERDASTLPEDPTPLRLKNHAFRLLHLYQTQAMHGNLVFLSQAQAVNMVGMSEPMVKRCEQFLAHHGLIVRLSCRKRQAGYIRLLNPRVSLGQGVNALAAGATRTGPRGEASLNSWNIQGAVGYWLERKDYDAARRFAYELIDNEERADIFAMILHYEAESHLMTPSSPV